MGISDNQIANDAIDFINNYRDLADSDGNISDKKCKMIKKLLTRFG